MASDYKKINEKSRINLRSIREQRGDKTHFVYELAQNADDSKSKRLELHLCEKELLVWNDGCKFREEDVLRISSVGFSDKDLTQIGNFGEGFKAVYNYTDRPEVYSGDESFCLPDPTSISKTLEDLASSSLVEGIDRVPPRIAELVEEGRTVFRLPFKENLRQEDLKLLKDQLRQLLKKRPLLFLPHLETIQWYDICSGQTGTYCRCQYGKIQGADQVELKASMNGEVQESERFLIFSKKFQPPPNVIDELLEIEYPERRKRIQETVDKLQPIEVAFKLQDGKIIAMDNCVLFAYLSTEKETHLRFFIQARYQTNPARNDIEKTEQNPWNKWLVQETAKFLPEILEQLKVNSLLEPSFFNVVPLKEDNVPSEFSPIAEALQKSMQERAFVPTENGEYAKAENVFYPHHGSLREFVECSWIYPNSSWLHPDIGRSGRAFSVMQEAKVKEISVSQVLNWLEKRDCNWFEARSNEWLRSLYDYLNDQESQLERINGLERIKKLPLVRLENGQHVCGSEAFFPPDTDEAREEIAPFLDEDELPILQSALLEGEVGHDIKGFLEEELDVRGLDPQEMVGKWILPQYSQCNKPSKKQNLLHVRYIFKVWDKLDKYEHWQLKAELCRTPILRAYNNGQPETFSFVKPDDAYLPEAYTGDTHLETYFSVYNGGVWFVDSGYLDDNSNSKDWFKFLKAIKAMDTPRVDKIEVVGNHEECKKRGIEYQKSIQRFEDGEFKNVPRRGDQYFDGHIVDPCWVGWSQVLAQIKKSNGVNLSCSVWNLLIKTIKPLSPEIQRGLEASSRDAFFQGTYSRVPRLKRTVKTEKFEGLFYRELLIDTDWLPDEKGKLRQPSKLFAPTDENRKVLGNSVAYLHPDFDVSQDSQTARWLAEKLDISLNADTNSVLNHLRTLSGTEASVKDVEPLYRSLNRQDARRSEEFKKNRLIFTPNPESRWWRVDEVFWEDKSEVLENDRRCLKAHYPAILKSFFIDLGVSEQASQRDYACRIQEIATTEQAADKKVRERLRRLYKCLITWQKHEWEIIYNEKCWLGKEGKEWGFFTRQKLVLKDHPHIGEIFEGKVPFWTGDDDLLSLALTLKIEECSQAQDEFHSEGDQEEDADWSRKVRNLCRYIYAFLNSPRLSEEEKRAEVLDQLSVCRVKELKVTYKLKGIPVPDPDPRLSFLDVSDQEAKLWLGLEVNEIEYAELIGDALQAHFDIKELGRFVEDLLTPTKKRDKVLSNWKRKGLDTKFLNEYPKSDKEEKTESLDEKLPDVPNSGDADPASDESNMKIPTDSEIPKIDSENNESLTNKADESEIHLSSSRDDDSRVDVPQMETITDSETTEVDESDNDSTSDESESPINSVSDIRNINSPDTQSLTKTGGGITQNVSGESESETPTVREDPDTGNENDDSTENESETAKYQPRPGGNRTRQRYGYRSSTSNRSRSTGYGSGGSGGGEGEKHRTLKEYLADNPSQLGAGLTLVQTEYEFESGDRVDILLQDSSGNPVTVEVKPYILPESYGEVWQAVRYKHIAAVQYKLPSCKQVRSILAAPEIPDDVKAKCKELGIEPFEKPEL
ncbi:DUF91 domain-containing protein [Candidatus Poribacteria bacterium]|nr:DUF91 domain-containing protein [Candidatus Poribacteria bacterium]